MRHNLTTVCFSNSNNCTIKSTAVSLDKFDENLEPHHLKDSSRVDDHVAENIELRIAPDDIYN